MTPDDKIWIIVPYYDNPSMLEKQVENWERYSGDLQKRVEFLVVDDCSPVPAQPIFEKLRHSKHLFRVQENIPWAQHHARNIGAREAIGTNPWLFMSDMDIICTPEAMNEIIEKCLDKPERAHTFERHFVGVDRQPKYHCNTFLVKKKHYWAVNGYDCDYCGCYGGDGRFLQQLYQVAPQLHHGKHSKHLKSYTECTDEEIILYGYETDIVPDANTREWERKNSPYHAKYREILAEKRAKGDERSKDPIRWEYRRVI